MAQLSIPKRATFRHGNLPDALMEAALRRLESDGVTSITVRELARDTGVNHRAIYRHFPDKASLLAHVAERCWKDFMRHLKRAVANKPPGEPMLIAAGVALYVYGRDHPNIFHFGGRARSTFGDEYPRVEAAAMEALQIFAVNMIVPMISIVYWNGEISPSAELSINMATLVGTFIGQVVVGVLGDRLGRKKMHSMKIFRL